MESRGIKPDQGWEKEVELLEILKARMSSDELLQIARAIRDSYSPFMPDRELRGLLRQALPAGAVTDESFRLPSHDMVNTILMNFYPGEEVVKYHLVKTRVHRRDEITAFEIGILNSRLDLGTINGRSYAYEIKTELDTLAKLERQLIDYSAVFEFVTVVAHEAHCPKVLSMIPMHCGVRSYRRTATGMKFRTVRTATRSPLLNSISQVSCLNSEELQWLLKENGVKNVGNTRKQRVEALFKRVPERRINALFKYALKRRFKTRWQFVTEHFAEINPVDLQTFFSSRIDPRILYYRDSSIVYK